MTEYGIRLGSAIMTLVDPWRGHEVEFNRWYERDHLYGGATLGPSVFSAARFVARASEKKMRKVAGGCDAEVGTLLSLYWLVGDGSDFWKWTAGNVKRLTEAGRMSAKGSVRTAQFLRHPWAERDDADGVPAELALDRRFPGLVVTVVEADRPESHSEFNDWYRASCVRHCVAGSGGADLCIGFTAGPVSDLAHPSNLGGSSAEGTRAPWTICLWFLDGEPALDGARLLAEHDDVLRRTTLGRIVWASPFIATVPGTDRYLDQVWLT